MKPEHNRRKARKRRQTYVRRRISGTPERPRLNIYRSLSHIYAQVIDDTTGITLASASTIDRETRGEVVELEKIEQAKVVGKKIAERAMANGVEQVVFDRGGNRYHGRVKALADAAREAGLKF